MSVSVPLPVSLCAYLAAIRVGNITEVCYFGAFLVRVSKPLCICVVLSLSGEVRYKNWCVCV